MIEYLNKLYKGNKEKYFSDLSNDLKNKKKRFIVTVNPEMLMLSTKDTTLKEIMGKDFSYVPDGIGVVKASRKCDINITVRITGIDIAEFLLNEANRNGYSVYLFGASEEVITDLVNMIDNRYPNINLLGYSNGYEQDKDRVMNEIFNLKPDICMVALGIPLQEKLIYQYYDKFSKGIFIGVGGTFDVLSGNKKRAPKIFIKLNLEWLYRIVCEPKRLKRFWNNNIIFLLKIRKEARK